MIALLFLRGGPFLLLVFRIVVKISSALNRFTGSFKFSKRKSLKRSRTIQEMSSVENAMNFPKFLYSGVVKKLHKRNQTKCKSVLYVMYVLHVMLVCTVFTVCTECAAL